MNPLDVIIHAIKCVVTAYTHTMPVVTDTQVHCALTGTPSHRKLPKKLVVADFGCGEGRLAKSVPHKVHSFDLVAAHDHIVACDIANVSTASSPEVPPPTTMLTISPLSGASEGQ